MPEVSLIILGGAFVGGAISGLTGFGTGLVTLPIWLHVIPPLLASPLVALCSIVAQLQTLPAIWHAIDFRRLAPFIAGGAAGVPLGAWALPRISVDGFKTGIGLILVVVCSILLLWDGRVTIRRGGRAADAGIGLCGGILGGLAGLSGPIPTLWASLSGWDKDERRAVFQGFNLSILGFAMAAQAAVGYLSRDLWWLLLAALPGTVAGAWLGRRLYGRLNVEAFDRTVLLLLIAAGATMVITTL